MAEEKKIGAIKEELQAAEDSMLPDFIARYEKDERSGVKSLVEKAGKRIQKLEAEYARIENLKKYEKEYAGSYHPWCRIRCTLPGFRNRPGFQGLC